MPYNLVFFRIRYFNLDLNVCMLIWKTNIFNYFVPNKWSSKLYTGFSFFSFYFWNIKISGGLSGAVFMNISSSSQVCVIN